MREVRQTNFSESVVFLWRPADQQSFLLAEITDTLKNSSGATRSSCHLLTLRKLPSLLLSAETQSKTAKISSVRWDKKNI